MLGRPSVGPGLACAGQRHQAGGQREADQEILGGRGAGEGRAREEDQKAFPDRAEEGARRVADVRGGADPGSA